MKKRILRSVVHSYKNAVRMQRNDRDRLKNLKKYLRITLRNPV